MTDFRDAEAENAELGMLACALERPELSAQAAPEVFTHYLRRELWAALQVVSDAGLAPDPTTLARHVRDLQVTMRLVIELRGTALPSNFDTYAGIVHDRTERRRVEAITDGLRQRAANLETPIADVAAWAVDQLANGRGATEAPVSTWTAVDLADVVTGVLAGNIDRPTPSIGVMNDGRGLFYRGRVNGIAGESGCGKTWTALHAAAQELAAGNSAVYVDLEDDAVGAVSRLLDLGASPKAVLSDFVYFQPAERPTPGDLVALRTCVAERRPTLVVVDSTGEGLSLEGAKPNEDDEVARWFRRVPASLAAVDYDGEPGPAVVVLDHVTKADESGLWPIGSQRKRAAIRGAQFMQRTVRPFSKDTAGRAVLITAKDRHGNYRVGQKVAELTVTPDGGPLSIELLAVVALTASGKPWRPTALMERISHALEQATPKPLSQRDLEAVVPGKAEHKRAAIATLVAEGFVATEKGPRNATLHSLMANYRQDHDPESDAYKGGTHSASETSDSGPVTASRANARDTGRTHSPRPGRTGDAVGTHSICTACGEPMVDLADGNTTHPNCEISETP